MTWFNLLVIVLGSSVVATVITCVWNLFLELRRKEAERKEKLYGPLRLYLKLIKDYRDIPTQLREDMRKNHKEITKNLDEKDAGKLLIQSSHRFSKEIGNPAVNERWFYTKKIEDLLKQNSGLIKPNHWLFVEKFFHSLILRKLGVGMTQPREGFDLFTDETTDQATKQIFASIESLQEKILNEC